MRVRLDARQLDSYRELKRTAGMVSLPNRTAIELTGGDRHRFLHNLCTHDIQSLQPGQGREAFFCNVQGKILAHAFVLCQSDRLLVNTVPGQSDCLVAHLDKYLITDDVQLSDRSNLVSQSLVVGPDAAARLANMGLAVPHEYLEHGLTALDQSDLPAAMCCRVDMGGKDSFLLQVTTTAATLGETLKSHGFSACDDAVFQVLRIESGFPLFGVDINDKYLPQEVCRDARALSFTKGCYLGQETVARIDALGHVNWHLVRLAIEGDELPSAGTEVLVEDRSVGAITSSVISPKHESILSFARVRREFAESDTRLHVGNACIVAKVC